MKKIFLLILALPLISLANEATSDRFQAGRVADQGDDPNAAIKPDGATATKIGTTSEPVCDMCVTEVRLGDNTTTTKITGTKPSNSSEGQTGQ